MRWGGQAGGGRWYLLGSDEWEGTGHVDYVPTLRLSLPGIPLNSVNPHSPAGSSQVCFPLHR